MSLSAILPPLIWGALVLFVASCTSAPSTTDVQEVAEPNATDCLRPEWVDQQSVEGYLVIIGIGPPQNIGGIKAQRRVALLQAHKELANLLGVRIRSIDRLHINQGKYAPELEQVTQASSTAAYATQAIQIDKEWIDPQSGELYLRILVPRQH